MRLSARWGRCLRFLTSYTIHAKASDLLGDSCNDTEAGSQRVQLRDECIGRTYVKLLRLSAAGYRAEGPESTNPRTRLAKEVLGRHK